MKAWLYSLLTGVVLFEGLSKPHAAVAQENLYKKAAAQAQEGKLAEAEESANGLLMQASNQMAQLLVFRAGVRAQMGRFQDAAADLQLAIQWNPSDAGAWTRLTPLLVQDGEIAKYRTHCEEMLRRFHDTTDARVANGIAKGCLLLPSGLLPEDVTLAEKLADKSVALTADGQFFPWRSMTQAWAEYRRGAFAKAIELIEAFQKQLDDARQSGALSGAWNECKADAWFIAAMAHQQLKETDEAHAALAHGREIVQTKLPRLDSRNLGPGWWDVLIPYILMSEARKTVGK